MKKIIFLWYFLYFLSIIVFYLFWLKIISHELFYIIYFIWFTIILFNIFENKINNKITFFDYYTNWFIKFFILILPIFFFWYEYFINIYWWIDSIRFSIWWMYSNIAGWIIFTAIIVLVYDLNLFLSKEKPKIIANLNKNIYDYLIFLKEKWYHEKIEKISNNIKNLLNKWDLKNDGFIFNFNYDEKENEPILLFFSKNYLHFFYFCFALKNDFPQTIFDEINNNILNYKKEIKSIENNLNEENSKIWQEIKKDIENLIKELWNDNSLNIESIKCLNSYLDTDSTMWIKEKNDYSSNIFKSLSNSQNNNHIIIYIYNIFDSIIDKINFLKNWYIKNIFLKNVTLIWISFIFIIPFLIDKNLELSDYFDSIIQNSLYWIIALIIIYTVKTLDEIRFDKTTNWWIMWLSILQIYNTNEFKKFENSLKTVFPKEKADLLKNLWNDIIKIINDKNILENKINNFNNISSILQIKIDGILSKISNESLQKLKENWSSFKDIAEDLEKINNKLSKNNIYYNNPNFSSIYNEITQHLYRISFQINYPPEIWYKHDKLLKTSLFILFLSLYVKQLWNAIYLLMADFSRYNYILKDKNFFKVDDLLKNLSGLKNSINNIDEYKKEMVILRELENELWNYWKELAEINKNYIKISNDLIKKYNIFKQETNKLSWEFKKILNKDFISEITNFNLNRLDRWWISEYEEEFTKKTKLITSQINSLYEIELSKKDEIEKFIILSSIFQEISSFSDYETNKSFDLAIDITKKHKWFDLLYDLLFKNFWEEIMNLNLIFLINWLIQLVEKEDFIKNYDTVYFLKIKEELSYHWNDYDDKFISLKNDIFNKLKEYKK